MDGAISILDRGAFFEAARRAFALWSWLTRPDTAQAQAIEHAAALLASSRSASPLLGTADAVRIWLDRGARCTRAALATLRADARARTAVDRCRRVSR